MAGLVVPPEICTAIVLWTAHSELPSLCLTSKAFLRAAECKLYEHLYLSDPVSSYHACQTIANKDRIALHVRTLWLYQDRRRSNNRAPLTPQYWMMVHSALLKTLNLDILLIVDPETTNSWVLRDTRFQLREANLRFTWDAHLVEFLQTQNRLRSLQTTVIAPAADTEETTVLGLQPGSLPSLEMYEGPILAAAELIYSPIANLQVFLEQETLSQSFMLLPRLTFISKSLRSLSILEIPEEISLSVFDLCSQYAPHLCHIGNFPIPNTSRHKFHKALIRLSKLQTIELDLTCWTTRPAAPLQRILAAEIRTFCPSINFVVIWFQRYRVLWGCEGDEGYWVIYEQGDSTRTPGQDVLWKTNYSR